MVDIQSPTTEIRRGKKDRRRKIETTGQKYNGLPYTLGRHKYIHVCQSYSKQKVGRFFLRHSVLIYYLKKCVIT